MKNHSGHLIRHRHRFTRRTFASHSGAAVLGLLAVPLGPARLGHGRSTPYLPVSFAESLFIITRCIIRCIPLALALALLLGCRTERQDVSFSGGDGASSETAIIINGMGNESGIRRAEEIWIQRKTRGAVVQRRNVVVDPKTGTVYDEVEIAKPDGKTTTVLFANPFAKMPPQIPAGNK
jgi:hypothetical protein